MIRALLVALVCFCDANEELTSWALLYREHVCTDAEAAWFAYPHRLSMFEEHAKWVGAFPENVNMRLVYVDNLSMEPILACEGVKDAVNFCRWQVFK